MSNLSYISILLLSISCASKNSVNLGTYKSKDPSLFRKGFYHLTDKIYLLNISLTLEDSNYTYTSCGNTIKGIWKSNVDTIFLKALSNEFNNDSLKKFGLNGKQPKIGTGYDTLFVKGKNILSYNSVKYNNKVLFAKTRLRYCKS